MRSWSNLGVTTATFLFSKRLLHCPATYLPLWSSRDLLIFYPLILSSFIHGFGPSQDSLPVSPFSTDSNILQVRPRVLLEEATPCIALTIGYISVICATYRHILGTATAIISWIKPLKSSIDVLYLSTVLHGFPKERIADFKKEVKPLLKADGRLAIVEIQRQATPFDPPLDIRFSPEELKKEIDLTPKSLVEVGQYFCMQLFEN